LLRFVRARAMTLKHADAYVPVITVEIPNVMLQEPEELKEPRKLDAFFVQPGRLTCRIAALDTQ